MKYLGWNKPGRRLRLSLLLAGLLLGQSVVSHVPANFAKLVWLGPQARAIWPEVGPQLIPLIQDERDRSRLDEIRGIMLAYHHYPAEAIPLLERGLISDPANQPVHFWLGNAYADTGDIPQAVEHWRQVGAATYFVQLASHAGDAEEAERYYRLAMQIAPESAFGLGEFYWGVNRLEDAAWAFDLYAQVSTDPVFANVARGRAAMARGQWETAVMPLRAALEHAHRADEHSMILFYLGYSELRAGYLDTALSHLQELVTLDSNNALAYVWLGDAYVGRGNIAQARDAYAHALAISPGQREASERLKSLPPSNSDNP